MSIGIIGHFGGDKEFFDGQTIKTKNLDLMLKHNGISDIYYVDTYLRKENPFKLLLKTIRCIITRKKIFILLSVNGVNFYLPFFHYINKIFKRKIYHYIIGSELLEMVKNLPKLVKYLNSLEVNWFEYDSGTNFLKSQGVKNVETLSNCKYLDAVTDCKYTKEEDEPYKYCTFSRVMKEKGITDAAEAVAKLNEDKGKLTAILDIYGQIDSSYEEEFEQVLRKYSDCVFYKGMVQSNKSVEILKDYYALLFPTKWEGEGFPGTILDAFASGLPIIATDWNANKDLIENNKHGIIYPSNDITDLYEAITFSVDNCEKFLSMRKDCREEYEKYTPEKVAKTIISRIN